MGGLGDALGAAAWVLIFLGGLFVATVILIEVFCLAFAPIAGAICAVLARRKGLSVWRYTAAGTVYSALLFLPWVYLIQRMRGKRFQRIDIQTGYIAFYLLWALLIACNISFLVMAFGFAHGGEKAFGGRYMFDTFFVPWVLLVSEMRQGGIPRSTLHCALTATYIIWLLWIVTHLVASAFLMEFARDGMFRAPEIWTWSHIRDRGLFWVLNGAILTLGGAVLGLSWMRSRGEVIAELAPGQTGVDVGVGVWVRVGIGGVESSRHSHGMSVSRGIRGWQTPTSVRLWSCLCRSPRVGLPRPEPISLCDYHVTVKDIMPGPSKFRELSSEMYSTDRRLEAGLQGISPDTLKV